MKRFLLLFSFVGFLSANICYSQPGSFDTTFGVQGKVISNVGFNLRDLAIQTDGKIIAVGNMNPASTSDQFVVARYLANGEIDVTFGTGGSIKTLFGAKCGANSVALQDDGKIVVAGYTSDKTNNSGHRDAMIVRYTTNGQLDASFGNQGIKILSFEDSGKALAVDIQPDGKIVIGGQLGFKYMVARLLENSNLDVSFNTVGYATYQKFSDQYEVGAIKVLNDGKILVAGRGNNKFVIVKYNSNGSLDTSFAVEGVLNPAEISGTDAVIYNMLTFDNGDFIVIGAARYNEKYNGVMAKFNASGNPVTGFGNNGILINDAGTNLGSHGIDVVTFNDKIYAGYSVGPASNYDFKITAYNMNGVVDTAFGTAGSTTFYFGDNMTHDYLETMVMQPDGKIIMGGKGGTGVFSLARLLTDNVMGTNPATLVKNDFLVYPNPVTEHSILFTNLSEAGQFELKLYNIEGKLIANLGLNTFSSGVAETNLALPLLTQGVYFLKISSSGKEIRTLKIVY